MKNQSSTKSDKAQFLRYLMNGKASIADAPQPQGGLMIYAGDKVMDYTDAYGKTKHFPDGVDLDEFRKTHPVAIAIPHNGRKRAQT